jgi:hypothetical protein
MDLQQVTYISDIALLSPKLQPWEINTLQWLAT